MKTILDYVNDFINPVIKKRKIEKKGLTYEDLKSIDNLPMHENI